MIGVSTPEYQLSIGNLGEFMNRLESAELASGRIVSVYTRGNLGGVVQIFDPTTGTTVSSTLIFAGSANSSLFGFNGIDVVALSGGGFAVYGSGVSTSAVIMPHVWRFDAAGVQIGSPLPVLGSFAANATMHQTANGFMVTYSDKTTGVDVAYAQTFTAAGVAIGGPQLIGQVVRKEMDVVTLANGKMALVWDSNTGVKLAELTANGVLTGVTASVTTTDAAPFGWSMGSKIVAAGTGFVTLHMSGNGLVMNRFNAAFSNTVGPVQVLNPLPPSGDPGGYLQTDQNEETHDIAVTDNGVIVLAWAGFDPGTFSVSNVYIQFLSPEGLALTDPIIANIRQPDDQGGVHLTKLSDGRIFLTFRDDTNVLFGSQSSARGVFIDGPDSYYVGTAGANARSGGTGDDAMRGEGGNDTLSGLGGDDQVSGGDGDDSLSGGGGNDQVNGGVGNDQLLGEAGNDVLLGGSENDTVSGGDGNDTASGQDGDDLLLGDLGLDVLYGGASQDTLQGGGGSDTLDGGDGNDSLLGEAAADTLLGQAGNDVLDGGDGNDSIDGNAGMDRLLGQGGNDFLYAGSENDTVLGGIGNDILNGGEGNDNLQGGVGDDIHAGQIGNDRIYGGDGNDILYGGQSNDLLKGGAGNDELNGAVGNDTLTGNQGSDVFDFSFAQSEGPIGQDIITDFQVGVDRILIEGWNMVFGVSLTLESRPKGSSALITSTGDEILLRGISVAQFDVGDLTL